MKKLFIAIAASFVLALTFTTNGADSVSQEDREKSIKAFAEAHWQMDDASPTFEITGISLAKNGWVYINGLRGSYDPKKIRILSVSYSTGRDTHAGFWITFEVLGPFPGVRALFLNVKDSRFKTMTQKLARDLNPGKMIDDSGTIVLDLVAINFYPETTKSAAK